MYGAQVAVPISNTASSMAPPFHTTHTGGISPVSCPMVFYYMVAVTLLCISIYSIYHFCRHLSHENDHADNLGFKSAFGGHAVQRRTGPDGLQLPSKRSLSPKKRLAGYGTMDGDSSRRGEEEEQVKARYREEIARMQRLEREMLAMNQDGTVGAMTANWSSF